MAVKGTQARHRQIWIGAAVSLLALAALFWLIDPAEVWLALQTARYGLLLLSAAWLLLFLAGRAVRWRLLLRRQVGLAPVFHIQNIGYLLTLLLPLRLGDVARAVLIGRMPPLTILQGASTMVVERLLDLLFFVVLFPFTIAGLERLPEGVRTAALFSGVAAGGGIVVLVLVAANRPLVERLINRWMTRPAWQKHLGNLLDGLAALSSWRDSLLLLFWSVALWLPVILAYDAGLRAVGLVLPPLQVSFVVCMAAFGVAIPSSPGQLGVFHAAVFFAIHTALGYSSAAAVSFALLYHAGQYVLFSLLGGWGFFATGNTWQDVLQLAGRTLRRSNAGEV